MLYLDKFLEKVAAALLDKSSDVPGSVLCKVQTDA